MEGGAKITQCFFRFSVWVAKNFKSLDLNHTQESFGKFFTK